MNKNNTTLDAIDQQIIQQLQTNGRKAYRQIAKELDLSVGTITNRIQKLQKTGIIKGFQLEINHAALGYNLETIIQLQTTQNITETLNKTEYQQHITAAYNTTGEYNTTIKARFKTPKELKNFLENINKEETVIKTNTQLILETMNN